MSVHRLVVRNSQGDVSQGTAWAVAPEMVCSAFHVVGHCGDRRWMHELTEGVSYWLEVGGKIRGLTPAAFDPEADLALLSCAEMVGDAMPLADSSRKNVRFALRGYPGFHDAREFTLSGDVIDLRSGEGARSVQLSLDQGADADWSGISGAPVVDGLAVIAAVTSVTQGTATAWAAPVEAVRRLVELAGLAAQLARSWAATPGNVDVPVDARRLDEILQRAARERPEDAGIAKIVEGLARNRQARAIESLGPAEAVRLRDDYDVISVREGGRTIRPVASREFADILAESTRFGGRHRELAMLDRHALAKRSGYFFVTATSGFGKTALLARWIDVLRRRGENVGFHFFTRRVPDSLKPAHAFQRLNDQLLALHGLGGGPPRDDEARQRALYVDLLALPAPGGRALVVVLDGLDEALDTVRPSPAMFPARLGDGVHVVFSARSVAGHDWAADLELQLDDDARIELGRLDRADIAEILDRAGLPSDVEIAAKLAEKTSGDPFYVTDVVRALAKAGGRIEVLEELPATHSDYLNTWWKEAVKRIAQPGFVDLMGTLAALRAPLAARELADLSKDDQLDNARLGVLLDEAARYVDDDQRGRYWLRHDRIRQFVRVTLGEDIKKYDERVRTFATRWNDPAATAETREYGRRHVVAHLLAADRFADALRVLDVDFFAARWREDGSYSELLGDLDTMFAWAAGHSDDRDATCATLSLAATRESARDLMRGLPAPLCRAWVRLEGKVRPLEMLANLPSHRGEAREQLLAVAEEIFDLAVPGAAGRADRATAAELLARTVGLLPLVRADAWALEALGEVCRLLGAHDVDAAQAGGILRQGIAYVSQVDEQRRDLKAACLAHLAAAFVSRDRAVASRLVEEIDALASGLAVADRAVALAIAFPAYRELAPDRIGALAEATASELARDPGSSALVSAPLELLLSAWADAGARRIAGEAAEKVNFSVSLLRKLEWTDAAWQKVEGAIRSGDVPVLREAYDAFPERRPRLIEAMAAMPVQEQLTTTAWVWGSIVAGRWIDARAALATLKVDAIGDAVAACLPSILAQTPSAERDRTVDSILGILEHIPADGGAAQVGRAAHVLAKFGHVGARQVLGLAFRMTLAELPEGDADVARHVVAVALAGEGRTDQAVEVGLSCTWWHRRIAVLAAVLDAAAKPDDRLGVAERIGELLDGPRDETFLTDAVSAACKAAIALGTEHGDAASRLVEAARRTAHSSNRLMVRLNTWLQLERTSKRFGGEGAPDEGVDLLVGIRTLVYAGSEGASYDDLFSLCAGFIETGSAEAMLVEHELNSARGRALDGKQLVAVLSAASAAMARSDAGRAAEWLREATDSVDSSGGSDEMASIRSFQRVLRDLTGGMIGGTPNWMASIQRIVDVEVREAGSFAPDVLSGLLVRAWERILELAADAKELQSASADYVRRLGALPLDRADALDEVLARVLSELNERRGGRLDVDALLVSAASELGKRGHSKQAFEVAQAVADPERREASVAEAELFSYYHSLEDRTRVEQTLFEVDEHKSVAATVLKALRDGQVDDLANAVFNTLAEARVRRIQFNLAPTLAAIVMHRWGAQAGKDLVDSVAEFDRRLIAAASRAVRA